MPTINILQTFLNETQRQSLESVFTPYNIKNNPAHHLRELPLLYQLFNQRVYMENDYTGLLSHKFRLKSKISGERFLEFIENNPGYDVYFINPFPQLAYMSFNIWEQGEYFHHGIRERADKLLSFNNHNMSTENHGRDTNKHLLYANYWVGNVKFWESYIPFLLEMHEHSKVSKNKENNAYMSTTPYMIPTIIYPFIFERFFTTFIKTQPELKYLPYPHTEEETRNCCNSRAELAIYDTMHEVIDEWDSEGIYDKSRRQTFLALLGSSAEYELLMREIGTHPYA